MPRTREGWARHTPTPPHHPVTGPGDWVFHCHAVHHVMNHMVKQVGPRIRDDSDVTDYQNQLTTRPRVRPDRGARDAEGLAHGVFTD